MRVLLDTHILLWAVAMSSRLPDQARSLLEDATNRVCCSAASLWEIAIKAELRRQDFQVELPALRAVLPEMAIEELPVTRRSCSNCHPSTRTRSTACLSHRA